MSLCLKNICITSYLELPRQCFGITDQPILMEAAPIQFMDLILEPGIGLKAVLIDYRRVEMYSESFEFHDYENKLKFCNILLNSEASFEFSKSWNTWFSTHSDKMILSIGKFTLSSASAVEM